MRREDSLSGLPWACKVRGQIAVEGMTDLNGTSGERDGALGQDIEGPSGDVQTINVGAVVGRVSVELSRKSRIRFSYWDRVVFHAGRTREPGRNRPISLGHPGSHERERHQSHVGSDCRGEDDTGVEPS